MSFIEDDEYFYRRFTEKVKLILEETKKLAVSNNNMFIEPEEILYTMLTFEEPYIVEIFNQMEINLLFIMKKLKLSLPVNRGISVNSNNVRYSEETLKCFHLASDEALLLNSLKIDIQHLFLGIIRENRNKAAEIMNESGMTVEVVRKLIERIINKGIISPTHLTNLRQPFSSGAKPNKNFSSEEDSSEKKLMLDKYSRNITKLAAEGKLDPVIGRENEIERIVRILARRKKNNPILIGEPGVGKTAIVEKLAQLITDKKVPDFLWNMQIAELDLSSIVAGTKYRGQFEERMKKIIEEIEKNSNIILFIDEIHTLMEAGSSESGLNAGNILKPLLSRGGFKCIGATTLNEYKRFFEKNTALERRFHKILVKPSTPFETVEILDGLKRKYEEYHGVNITPEAISEIVNLSERFINDEFFPDKAIDIMDESCAKVRFTPINETEEIKSLQEKIKDLENEKNIAINRQEFETAANLRDEIKKSKSKMNELVEEEIKKQKMNVVEKTDITYVVSTITGVPLTAIEENEAERLINLQKILRTRIIGQDNALNIVSQSLKRSRTGVKNPNQPIGVFLFLGPTGVGKTELAKVLAEKYFLDKNALIKINMSEYMEKFTVSRLVGAPPGYVGYESGGQITEKVRHKPYSVVLFDEIEKADYEVFNILLQIFDEGMITDGTGRDISFRNTIIIMTSNIGAKKIQDTGSIGFYNEKLIDNYEEMEKQVREEVKKHFNPEFINRISDIVVFRALAEDDIRNIVDIIFKEVQDRLAERNIKVTLDESIRDFLVEKGFDKIYGARPLRRAIEHYLEDYISEEILHKRIKDNMNIELFAEDKKVQYSIIDNSVPEHTENLEKEVHDD